MTSASIDSQDTGKAPIWQTGWEVPSGPDWLHEVRHDGYRMLVIREDDRVRLLSRNGTDWARRYPWIADAALKNRQKHFVIDGEAVVLGVDGISDFKALHSRKYDHEVQLYTFDILAMGGDDLRSLPLHMRKTNLQQLLARRPDGITVAPFERGEIGPDLFRAACRMGLEGLVSKHRDRPYRGGRQKHWVKIKNRASGDESEAVRTGLTALRPVVPIAEPNSAGTLLT